MIIWDELYNQICKELLIDCKSDYDATKILKGFAIHQITFLEKLRIFKSENFVIYGPAGDYVQGKPSGKVAVVADSAIERIRNFTPDIIVSDMDGNIKKILNFWKKGSLLCIHAHGDNIPALRKFVPQLAGNFIGTCQSSETEGLLNLHGFTDGDRSVKLAQYLEAKTIRLDGFNFTAPLPKAGSREKIKKLKFAEMIILDSARERTGKDYTTIPEVF